MKTTQLTTLLVSIIVGMTSAWAACSGDKPTNCQNGSQAVCGKVNGQEVWKCAVPYCYPHHTSQTVSISYPGPNEKITCNSNACPNTMIAVGEGSNGKCITAPSGGACKTTPYVDSQQRGGFWGIGCEVTNQTPKCEGTTRLTWGDGSLAYKSFCTSAVDDVCPPGAQLIKGFDPTTNGQPKNCVY